MKTRIKNRFLVPLLIAALGLFLAGRVTAQTFTTLYSFNGGSDGAYPPAGLMQGADGALYGTASSDGSSHYGTVFKLNPDGTGFTVLKNFDYSTTGGNPQAALIQGTDGALYGTAYFGGSSLYGTVFKLNPDGTGFTVLKNFDNSTTGGLLYGGLIQGHDGALYGTTSSGGSSGYGTVFKLNADGTGFTVLKNFDNSTKAPIAGLIQGTDGALYGTTYSNGGSGYGTVFKLNPDGTGFTVLKNFDGSMTGGELYAGLMQGADGALYGTAFSGGSSGYGTVFKLNPDGTGFTVLQNFDGLVAGANPFAGLMQGTDGALYGTATSGGSSGYGTLFKLNPDGTGFTVLQNFDYSNTGANPFDALTQGADGSLYGTAGQGGSSGFGTIFKFALVQLHFTGFLAPISGADATGGSFAAPVRTFKAGSTIPVKFSISSEGAPVTTGVHSLQAIKFSNATTGGVPIDATPQDAATPGNQFRLTGSDWQFNLDTRSTGITTGIWQLVATLSDGSQHTVWVQIK